MRICITTSISFRTIGGVQQTIIRLAKRLVSCGHQVSIVNADIFSYEQPDFGQEIIGLHDVTWDLPENYRLDGLIMYEFQGWSGRNQSTYAHDLFQALQLLQRQHNYDLFHAFYLDAVAQVTLMVSKIMGVKSVLSCRGNDINFDMFEAKNIGRAKLCFDLASAVTVVSTRMFQLVEAVAETKQVKVYLVHNGLDETIFKYHEAGRNPHAGIVFGFVGRISSEKGPSIALYVVETLLAQGLDVYLRLICSSRDPETIEFIRIAEQSLKDRFLYSPETKHEEIISALKSIDILLHPSLDEGFPNTILEAMYAETAIIASDVGALPEIIENNLSGILVSPTSLQEMIDRARLLCISPDKISQLARNARRRVDTFSVEREISTWLQIYNEVLG